MSPVSGAPLVLGIDSSTQGTSAVLLDAESLATVARAQVKYRDDPRLARFGLLDESPILTPGEPGEALQPADLYPAALDAVLEDLQVAIGAGALGRVAAVNVSAQQHGQVWLGDMAPRVFSRLQEKGCGKPGGPGIADLIADAFAWNMAPIWMSANTACEAGLLRAAAGGSGDMTEISGSDSPLRFSGAVLMHQASRHPREFRRIWKFHLISSFLSGLLSGNPECPVDWGNGSGTSLMNWREKRWDEILLGAAADYCGIEASHLSRMLPALAHPLAPAGRIARYFVERHGFSPDCQVAAGSGDNPQSKCLAQGALLSLGTSFVLMAEGSRPHVSANAMYDGLGNPFLFACRTNGALVWERLRKDHGLAPGDFATSEEALRHPPDGSTLRILQPERESFPDSPAFDTGSLGSFEKDYPAVVDSTLGLLYLASKSFMDVGEKLCVTGGVSSSPAVRARIAALWNRPVVRIADAGAATGAALAAACALQPPEARSRFLAGHRETAVRTGDVTLPDPALIEAYHGRGMYLDMLEKEARKSFSDLAFN